MELFKIKTEHIFKFVATGLCGTVTGTLAYVTFVFVPSLF